MLNLLLVEAERNMVMKFAVWVISAHISISIGSVLYVIMASLPVPFGFNHREANFGKLAIFAFKFSSKDGAY